MMARGPGLVLIRKAILQICVSELVDRTGLSLYLLREGILKQWHELHPLSLQES